MPSSETWSAASRLLIELDPPEGATHRVVGLSDATTALVRIVGPSVALGERSLSLRPLVDPPGPFSVEGVLMFSPFLEADPDPDRAALRAFERRVGARYYEFLLRARYRYAATCEITAIGTDGPGTCGELYSIDASSIEEAQALDSGNLPPPDILAIYGECRRFIVSGSHRRVWLIPEPREGPT